MKFPFTAHALNPWGFILFDQEREIKNTSQLFAHAGSNSYLKSRARIRNL